MMLQRVQTKVQPFGCGHKMHSEAFPAHINLFQSRSITFSLELHWENNGGGKLSLGMFDSFFGRQIGVNYLMEDWWRRWITRCIGDGV